MFYNKSHIENCAFVTVKEDNSLWTVEPGDIVVLRSGSALLTVRDVILTPSETVHNFHCVYYNTTDGGFQTMDVSPSDIFLLVPPQPEETGNV